MQELVQKNFFNHFPYNCCFNSSIFKVCTTIYFNEAVQGKENSTIIVVPEAAHRWSFKLFYQHKKYPSDSRVDVSHTLSLLYFCASKSMSPLTLMTK